MVTAPADTVTLSKLIGRSAVGARMIIPPAARRRAARPRQAR
jgi:hypothetical protein